MQLCKKGQIQYPQLKGCGLLLPASDRETIIEKGQRHLRYHHHLLPSVTAMARVLSRVIPTAVAVGLVSVARSTRCIHPIPSNCYL